MTDYPRLIEHAFPLRQTSLDSVHARRMSGTGTFPRSAHLAGLGDRSLPVVRL